MNTEQNNAGEEREPSPTSPPPQDVEIPVETIYGDNRPIDPLQPSKPKTEENIPSSQGITSRFPETGNTNQGKTIKIGLIPFIILILLLGAGIFTLGNKYRVKLDQNMPSFIQNLPATTELGTNEQPKQKRTINFVRDLGLYTAENQVTAPKLASSRLKLAKSTIIWVTSEPNNKEILGILRETRKRISIPIYIVTGRETSTTRIREAINAGFEVNIVKTSLEIPYSVLLIDNKILIDMSRDNWLWETSDKDIIEETAVWANKLLIDSKIIKLDN